MGTMTQPTPARTKTTIFKETLPPEDRSATDAQPSAFYARDWETVMQDLTPEQWKEHKVRVYRADEKWDRSSSPVDNVFTAAFGEEDLRARFGGGRYLLWLLGPPKQHNLVGKYQVTLDGQPILNGTPRNGIAANSGDTVAIEAMRLYANPEFVRMQMQMMVTAATQAMELIKGQMPKTQDPLETLKNAKEILGIGQPKDNLLDTIRVLKEIGLIGSPEKKGIDEVLTMINTLKTSGLIPSGAPKADLASTFAANLPMLVDRAVTGLHEFRLQAEAQERTVRMSRGEMRPDDPNVITVKNENSSGNSTTAAAGAPASVAAPVSAQVSPEVAQAIIAQSHLVRLVQGIKQPDSTGQDMYDYLLNAWPEVLDELAKYNKETLLAFFKNREMQKTYFGSDILAEVGDDPRLPKMIEDFLRIAKENAEVETTAAAAVASTQVV